MFLKKNVAEFQAFCLNIYIIRALLNVLKLSSFTAVITKHYLKSHTIINYRILANR